MRGSDGDQAEASGPTTTAGPALPEGIEQGPDGDELFVPPDPLPAGLAPQQPALGVEAADAAALPAKFSMVNRDNSARAAGRSAASLTRSRPSTQTRSVATGNGFTPLGRLPRQPGGMAANRPSPVPVVRRPR